MPRLELLVSGPGTGKTTYCIDQFRRDILQTKSGIDASAFFVLPSREHADRIQHLVLGRDIPGLFNAHILTIHDFASRFLGGWSSDAPTDVLRESLLREVFEDLAASGTRLDYFDRASQFDGFYRLLVDSVKEFGASLLSMEDFERRAQPLLKNKAFKIKFRDFSIVFKRYRDKLEEAGLMESDQSIVSAIHSEEEGLKPSLVIFDGFYRFTRAQQLLIGHVSQRADRMLVSLTMPSDASEYEGVFDYCDRTRNFLEGIGFKRTDGFQENRRTSSAGLRHLTQAIFRRTPIDFEGDCPVEILKARSIDSEIEMIARTVRRLSREKGLYYSDFCIILRRIEGYDKILRTRFAQWGIPIHVHERRKLIESSFVPTLNRLMQVFLDGWKRADVSYVIKSAYCFGADRLESSLALEGRIAASRQQEGREVWMDADTEGLLAPVLDWQKSLYGARTAEEFSARFYAIARQMREVVPETDRRALEAVRVILRNAARFRSQKHDFIPDAYMRDIQSAMEGALFSEETPGRNSVQVYDTVMALPKEYKVVFVAGLLEKRFPETINEDPLFKDAERRVINRSGTVLEERSNRAAGERYFFYMAFTRAKESVYLTYPLYDADGRQAQASFFVDEVRRAFGSSPPAVRTTPQGEFVPPPQAWELTTDLARGKALWSGEPSEEPPAVLSDPKVLKHFEAAGRRMSPTRLEILATCSFKYFAAKILKLDEPLHGHEAREMGNLLHATLDQYFKAQSVQVLRSGDYMKDPGRMRSELERILDELFVQSPFAREPLYRQHVYRKNMARALALFVSRECELMQERSVTPTYFEWEFKDVEIGEPDSKTLLEGKIDRIDVDGSANRAWVIDYKRSRRSMTIAKRLAKDIEYQLPLYAVAVRKVLGMETAGAELRFLQDGKEERLTDGFKAAPDAWTQAVSDIESRVSASLRKLRSGRISVDTKTCEHCSYSPVCRFESWKLIYKDLDV